MPKKMDNRKKKDDDVDLMEYVRAFAVAMYTFLVSVATLVIYGGKVLFDGLYQLTEAGQRERAAESEDRRH